MKRLLFLIHDLGQGGAEKVLVNLVNNMDRSRFDITVMTLFDVGVNRQFLAPDIRYRTVHKTVMPGNSHMMKLLTPRQLHKLYIKEHYDIEISYLEGPCARVISGCPDRDTRLLCWIHREMVDRRFFLQGFRGQKEAEAVYNRFDRIVAVSQTVRLDFEKMLNLKQPAIVLYNTNESDKIRKLAEEAVEDTAFRDDEIKLIGIGKLLQSKGFDRLLEITKQLREGGLPVHSYILGIGPEEDNLKRYIRDNNMEKYAELLGYQTNPYKYLKSCDIFVCASHAEGFSTAATEALITGVPVCTVEVSGMKEMLGDNNEYGIVTDNTNEALAAGIAELAGSPELLAHYKRRAAERGNAFNTAATVRSVEEKLLELCGE